MGQKIRMKNVSYAKNVLETDQKKLEKPYNMPLVKDLAKIKDFLSILCYRAFLIFLDQTLDYRNFLLF